MEPSFRGVFDKSKYSARGDNIPRILLRGWHPGTAAAALGLNTDRGIYPFAWHFDVLPASNQVGASREPIVVPPCLTDLSKGDVLALAATHINGDTDILSVFTSWTADLPTAVFFALGEYNERGWVMNTEPGFIAVVHLTRPRPIIHATDLGWQSLPMEYLIHGPVTEGLRVVPIPSIRSILNCHRWPFCHGVRREPHSVTEEEIRDSVRLGLLFLTAADTHVDVAIIVAASLLAWGQVPVASPSPLGEADLLRARQQQTRPWPAADIECILKSRLLVHDGACPPLSGANLANPLTSTEAWAPASDNTTGTSQPRLTREQWETAFREAAYQHTPIAHLCGPFICWGCGDSQANATPTDYSRPNLIHYCSPRCAAVHDLREAIRRAKRSAESP